MINSLEVQGSGPTPTLSACSTPGRWLTTAFGDDTAAIKPANSHSWLLELGAWVCVDMKWGRGRTLVCTSEQTRDHDASSTAEPIQVLMTVCAAVECIGISIDLLSVLLHIQRPR